MDNEEKYFSERLALVVEIIGRQPVGLLRLYRIQRDKTVRIMLLMRVKS